MKHKVAEAGYAAYNHTFHSDHRLIYLKVEFHLQKKENFQDKGRRPLNSKISSKRDSYLDEKKGLYELYALNQRLDKLESKSTFTEEDGTEINKIDIMIKSILLHSETKLRKGQTNGNYTERIHGLKQNRRYWRLWLK